MLLVYLCWRININHQLGGGSTAMTPGGGGGICVVIRSVVATKCLAPSFCLAIVSI
jgi:hypothetical protein